MIFITENVRCESPWLKEMVIANHPVSKKTDARLTLIQRKRFSESPWSKENSFCDSPDRKEMVIAISWFKEKVAVKRVHQYWFN